jgi:predicted ATPase with chaperone activity
MSNRFPEVFTLLNGAVSPRCQEIEIASSFQIPTFQIIGLPGPEVAEARDRIRSAFEASGIEFPRRKLILNLSPAAVRKEGTGLLYLIYYVMWKKFVTLTRMHHGQLTAVKVLMDLL